MALLISCLKHVVKLCFVEQWRLRVFLILNLVLLAIFFCSIYAKPETQESNCGEETKIKNKKRRYSDKSMKIRSAEEEIQIEKEQEQESSNTGIPVISEEELNKRVEAFIAMFRQQLASDARRASRNHHRCLSTQEQTNKENLKLHKECGNSTQKLRCVVVQV